MSHIRLRVRDLERSVAFYRELFGLHEKPHQVLGDKVRECVARDPHREEFGIAFSQSLTDEIAIGRLEQLSFEVATVEEAAELYSKARELGAQAIRPRLYGGCWRTFIFDPDGHKLEITAKDVQLSQGTAV